MAETLPIVVPVRYSGGGLTMQTTSSRLSAEGVFVRGFVTPKEGAVLSLTLTLPGVPVEFLRDVIADDELHVTDDRKNGVSDAGSCRSRPRAKSARFHS